MTTAPACTCGADQLAGFVTGHNHDCPRWPAPALQPPDSPPMPAPDDLVWVATERRAVEAHKPTDDGVTVCRRSMRTGGLITAQTASETYQASRCPRCWPLTEGAEAA